MSERHDDGAPRPVEDLLNDLETLLDQLTGTVISDEMSTPRLMDASARLRVAGTRIDAARWTILPRIEAAGLWAQSGARTFAVWVARAEDVQTLTARREVRTARALRDHLPATLDAALAGTISTDKIRALVDVATTSTPRTNALAAPAIDPATLEPTPDPNDTTPIPEDATNPAEPEPAGPTAGAISPTWEEQLLDWSTQNGPDRFRGLVRYFARHADPDADERGYTKAKEREYLDVSPTLGGYHLSGYLTEEHGQTLTTTINSIMGTPTPSDTRTPGQRRAQALADMTRIVLDHAHTGTGASIRPHLNVTVSWTELQALAAKTTIKDRTTGNSGDSGDSGSGTGGGTGSGSGGTDVGGGEITLFTGTTGVTSTTGSIESTGTTGAAGATGAASVKRPAVFTDTNTPVPTSLLRRIACDSQLTRIIFGPDNQILNVGRTQRTITGHLRRAVIARDQHCVLGQCDQPPSRCEVHHAIRHWADGGETSTTNAALLCWHHHDLVDTQNIAMHYDNGWHFTDRHGQPIYTNALRT